jgi:hypothetical protein
MYGRFNAQYKLAAEFLFAQRVRHFMAVRVNQFNHFFHGHAQFGTVALQKEFGNKSASCLLTPVGNSVSHVFENHLEKLKS